MRSDQYSMTLSKRCIFISIFHYLIFNLANCKCQESFKCGPLGSLQFPFSNMQRDCGLFMVNCNSPTPRVQLEDGEPYLILQKLSENKFRIRDTLETLDCTIFRKYQYLLHTSPSISSTISYPNSTLFKCPAGLSNPLLDDYISAQNYSRYSCPDFLYYWRRSSADGEIATHQPCIKMPLRIFEYWEAWNKIHVSIWIVEFDVELNVSDACLKCHQRGGRCGNNSMNQFLCTRRAGNRRLKKVFLIGGVTAFISTSIVMFLFIWRKYTPRRLFGFQKAKPGNEKDIELFLKINGNHAPKRYSYSEIKKMTKSFSENLGKGGYGSVYKGKLPDGRLVAVKILNESKGNGEEFMNEVASISRTSHINIVTLYGFCFKGSKRALIYEFMTNGSLDKFIQNTPSSVVVGVLGWQKLSEIALGIARGLEYLHQGCNTRILHFDIKPHNILLDEDFNPRISDFGLAKLCPNRSSIVSMLVARGTIGYIAPEVFCRNFGEVSHKSDVYSYGMMVLEIAGVKKTIDPGDVNCSSETYFPHYVYKQLEMDGERDDGIMVEDERQLAWRKLIIVGLWCIQTDPKDRPSMTKVVEMLEGQLESLRVPPKPYLSSHPTSAPQFSFSESV